MKKGNPARRAVFVDRDGTLNEMVYDETHGLLDSPRLPSQVKMIKGAGVFLRRLKQAGYLVVVVSNQPGLAKNTLTEERLAAVNRALARQLEREGDSWDEIRCCPHHPRGSGRKNRHVKKCACRKPAPGLLLEAARERGLDLKKSWMVGDGLNDVQAGKAAGCKTVLVTRLKIDQVELFFSMNKARPDHVVSSLDKAFETIAGPRRRARG